MEKLTISTFQKNKDVIKAAVKGVTSVVSRQRSQKMDKVEKLLLIFIKEKEIAGDSVICEKALEIYNALKIVNFYHIHYNETLLIKWLSNKTPGTNAEGESEFTFKASIRTIT